MQLATRNIEPVDGQLDDSCAGLCKGEEKFDVERESLFAETAPDRFVASAPKQLEATL